MVYCTERALDFTSTPPSQAILAAQQNSVESAYPSQFSVPTEILPTMHYVADSAGFVVPFDDFTAWAGFGFTARASSLHYESHKDPSFRAQF